MTMRQGRRHQDLPRSLLILPALSLAVIGTNIAWGWSQARQTNRLSAATAPASTGVSSSALAAEQAIMARFDEAHPFGTTFQVPNTNEPGRLTAILSWQRALIDLRLRSTELLSAEAIPELVPRAAKLDQLVTAWDSVKSVEEVNRLVGIARRRRDWWIALENVKQATAQAQAAAVAKNYAACLMGCTDADGFLTPWRDNEEFDNVFGELATAIQDLRPWAALLSRVSNEYAAISADPTVREVELGMFVQHYAHTQPAGIALREVGLAEGTQLWDRAELELAMLCIDLEFGAAPNSDQPPAGRMAKESLSKRLEMANSLRRRFPRTEVTVRLRGLFGMWMRSALADRSYPLPDLDPKLQETVNAEQSVLAVGIYDPVPGRADTWRFWRSVKEQTAKPDMPEHLVTIERGQADAKPIAGPPHDLFIRSAIKRYNESVQSLKRRGALLAENNWQIHVAKCQELEREAAEVRSRVRNHGLAGGNTKDEQDMILAAYLTLDFRNELSTAQEAMAAFEHLTELARPLEGAAP